MTIAEPTLDELVDAEAVFDEILKELLGEQKSRVRADVATHTETMWGTHKDLEAARKRLVLEAAKLVAAGLRPSTRSSHRSGCRTYEHFCDVFRFRAYGAVGRTVDHVHRVQPEACVGGVGGAVSEGDQERVC